MPVCGAMPFRWEQNSFRVPEQTPSKQNSFRVPEQTLLTISNEVGKLALARTDWKESSTAIVISLDVPGLKKDDVKIEVEDNRVLTISGQRKVDEEEAEGVKWLRAEWTTGKFRRQLSLPANADLDRIKAYLQDGVLRITVPKYSSQAKVIRIVDGCSCARASRPQ